jgi:hypothetical protein
MVRWVQWEEEYKLVGGGMEGRRFIKRWVSVVEGNGS